MSQFADPVTELDQLSPEKIELIREHVKAVLASHAFEGSKRAGSFLRLVVERALAGRLDDLRERMIGAEMFGRPIDYDTANDAVVRVKATEVRKRLAQHYHELKVTPPVRIELPAGSYVPKFVWRSTQELVPQAAETVETGPSDSIPLANPSQEFVTITQELPDAFAVVLRALERLTGSVTEVPVKAAPASPVISIRWMWAAGSIIALLLAGIVLSLLFR